MTLRELQYLLALADTRSFRRAAELCSVSQPTLSTQIRKLEEELGVALIERTPRKAMLTPAGRDAVERARRILTEVDQLKEAARRSRFAEGGALKLGVFPTLGPYLLPHVVPLIRQRFPELELLLFEEKSANLIQRLNLGTLDAAFLALPVHDSHFHSEFLFEEPFLLAVPGTHSLARRDTLGVAELAGQNLMLLEEGHCLRDQALDVCHQSGAREKSEFRATSLETLRQMVAAGVGITLLPMLATRNPVPPAQNIHLLAFSDSRPSRQIALLWRKTSALGQLLHQVADICRGLPEDLLTLRH
ncbi:LysR substrate-binding domain-containing protein [Xanthobacter sp.]|uniref:LysR substrate-binding domain-containing protein n=1 Tax=Xanthobacter TaxID=279 RepID=UPI0025F549DF|nr:LysR substrate-binding domain-containing protein [Xanthobacter sp.]